MFGSGIKDGNPLGALYVNISKITGGAQNRGVVIGKSWVTNTTPSQIGSGEVRRKIELKKISHIPKRCGSLFC